MISAVTSSDATSAAASAAMKKATGMNKDDFLKLFMTQLQNQDPLNPQDSSQFIGQLAQLTQLEQSYNTNTNLQSLLTAQNDANSLSAISFVGKDVLASGSQVCLTDGSQPVLNYRTSQAAAQTTINITDANGTNVRTLYLGQTAAGDYNTAWDGKDDSGNTVAAGTYNFAVKGTDASGNTFSGTSLIYGAVDGVKLDGSSPVLSIGGLDVPLSSVLSINGAV
jgi:flagellar basal-body rod modification protein FlgD